LVKLFPSGISRLNETTCKIISEYFNMLIHGTVRTLLGTVTDLQATKKVGNLLSNTATISFPRRTLLNGGSCTIQYKSIPMLHYIPESVSQ
jgi:hypothetical protein